MNVTKSIGIFDSGYGGLTVFKSIAERLPDYNYIYMGDNARSPYGDHSFETVYQYTLECVEWLFAQGCPLVILACNTASAKALRTIQQKVLPFKYPDHRVLGVIRPTAEVIGNYTETNTIGVMGTRGTVNSESYPIEISHFFPELEVFQQSCPLWVPLIENNEHINPGADYFVQKYVDALLTKSAAIDTILLACTHYPLLVPKLSKVLPEGFKLVAQGDIVASSLADYLDRHPEMESRLGKENRKQFFTSGDEQVFNQNASIFFDAHVVSARVRW
ncbi:glutamate racemase [Pedobacter sp. MC2016-15]|uniref:glutamate racemase n=1 Tax=Pedobacter sp. MC2016-15 TaxID=2994473 RepID=UPI00224653F7|nr:glutamate racemase [Pedobacter sp. MC2016-15]MCX2479180.1 glutamate racemase [Pedobacter sp. MC2016-15]